MEFTDPLPVCSVCNWIHDPDDHEACLGPPVNDADDRLVVDDDEAAYERSCS